MAPVKKNVELIEKPVTITVHPAFSASCDDPMMSGISGMGKTAREAINNLRSEIKRRYSPTSHKIVESATNVELWKATSWKDAVYGDHS